MWAFICEATGHILRKAFNIPYLQSRDYIRGSLHRLPPQQKHVISWEDLQDTSGEERGHNPDILQDIQNSGDGQEDPNYFRRFRGYPNQIIKTKVI